MHENQLKEVLHVRWQQAAALVDDCNRVASLRDSCKSLDKIDRHVFFLIWCRMRRLNKQNVKMIKALEYMEEVEGDRLYYNQILNRNNQFDANLK